MTGEKDKYTTHEKMWKLDDKELATPKHDELVLMMLDKGFTTQKMNGIFTKDENPYEIKSEVPVKARNGFIIGYIDILINTSIPFKTGDAEILCPICNEWHNIGKISELKEPDPKRTGRCPKEFGEKSLFILRDSWSSIRDVISYNYRSYYIECKPTIKSFGETLRQINTYREYTSSKFVLFTPDIRFKEAFESQDIHVISP